MVALQSRAKDAPPQLWVKDCDWQKHIFCLQYQNAEARKTDFRM